MPSVLKTFLMVRNNILKSNAKDIWSTYQTSNSNLLSQLIALRPFTCAHPVIPGLTSCLLFCKDEYKGKYSTNKGRGPTKLMSPLITLINWGSSSKEVLRINFPTLV